jgi:hypothetical protein
MEAYLARGVYMCLVDGGAIFLDISTNAYVGIDAVTKAALTLHLVGLDSSCVGHTDDTKPEPHEGIAALTRRGLLTHSKSIGRPFSPLTVPINHAVPFGTGRPQRLRINVMHVARFVVALTCASIMIRRGHLSFLITRILKLKEQLAMVSPAKEARDLLVLVHIFRRLSALFYTAKNACLLDSVVLTEFLIRQGHRPMLLLGVRTKPFLAHAWVQMDDCVLNDSLEHAQTLTPIAAI